MLVKTALLIVSNPNNIGKILVNIQEKVKKTLYIQLLSAVTGPLAFHSNLFTSAPKYSKLIWGIYSQAAEYCEGLDIQVLLSAFKNANLAKIRTRNTVELIIFDKLYDDAEVVGFLKGRVENVTSNCRVITFNEAMSTIALPCATDERVYKHAVLGGTFDRLHIAHKILLSEAALRSSCKLTVGVTDKNMLYGKTLWELVEPLQNRLKGVENFIKDVCPELETNIVPIQDLYGPTQHDPTMELLILSAETTRGGQKINEVREIKGLPKLDIFQVDLIEEPHRNPVEETKISSSTNRIRLLGTLLKAPLTNIVISTPYVIGLTGGIASGKSNISLRLKELGAEVIDCDKVAHKLYEPNKRCFELVVEHFGRSIVSGDGRIDRKILGSIVFKSSEQLQKLNSLVWPAIIEDVNDCIQKSSAKVVVVDAAVLVQAGWDKYCHEVWTSIISKDIAVERLKSRNGLTEEQALERIASQLSNETYVNSANVVFCSQWEKEFTFSQVDKAWTLLQERLLQ
ncbi:hypothetical protein FQA39_LY03624 [Lamprigera yunnana]|nr:hypothetical protein FQA39_LY03624 [Lamprigera yunnana]